MSAGPGTEDTATMTLLAVIALSAVTLMGIIHVIALRGERHRVVPRVFETSPLQIHRPRQG
jgi:hypothetical protein